MKLTLLSLDENFILQKSLKDQKDVLGVFLNVAGENQDVIQVNKNELIEHVSENIIYEGLEYCRGVGESKGHNQIFRMAEGGIEGCLSLISFFYPDQVVRIAQVQFSENIGLV